MSPVDETDAILAAKARRPPKDIWDLVFMPLGIAAAWWLLAKPIFYARAIGMPKDAFLAGPANELSILLFFLGVGIVAIGPGLMLSNLAIWAVPLLRARQDRLNAGDGEKIFRRAMRQLGKFSFVIFLVVYPLSWLGGMNYFALTSDATYVRPYLKIEAKRYGWDQLKTIESRCYRGGRSPAGRYDLVYSDGEWIDVAEFSIPDFFDAYPRLSSALRGHPFDFRFNAAASVSCPSYWRSYFEKRPG